MQLSDADIEEFCALCAEALDLTLTMDEARTEASYLLQLYELLVRPLPSERAARADQTAQPQD